MLAVGLFDVRYQLGTTTIASNDERPHQEAGAAAVIVRSIVFTLSLAGLSVNGVAAAPRRIHRAAAAAQVAATASHRRDQVHGTVTEDADNRCSRHDRAPFADDDRRRHGAAAWSRRFDDIEVLAVASIPDLEDRAVILANEGPCDRGA